MTMITTVSPTNPFATRFTSPGRLPPLADCGVELDLKEFVRRLRSHGNRAAIRGPHGSGKSTMLVALADRLHRDGRLGGRVRLGGGFWPDLLAVARGLFGCGRGRVLCIDSWERLGGVAATVVGIAAWAAGRGLLVTAHGEGWLPTLVSCSTTPRLLSRIVERLPDCFGLVEDADIEEAFRGANGNLREALFLLYDRFEQARGCQGRS